MTTIEGASGLPDGFRYFADILTAADEQQLLAAIQSLTLSAVVLRGYTARRRTAHFGAAYAYDSRKVTAGPPIPAFLLGVRERIAAVADANPARFTEALVTEYPPGAVIGWHRDAPAFGAVVLGVSLGSSCRMRFRRGEGSVERASILLEPRSGYVLSGSARREWQHSIPAVDRLRYSITFRTIRTRRRER